MVDTTPQSSINYLIAAGDVFKLGTDGTGDTQTGCATVVSDNPSSQITGTVIYSISGFEVSVPSSSLSPSHHVFAERDSSRDTDIATDFQGSVHAQSDNPFAMAVFRQKTSGSLTTLSTSTTAFSIDTGPQGEDPCGNALGNRDEIVPGPSGPVGADRDNPFRSLTVHPTNPNVVIVGTERNGVLKSSDGGVTWERFRFGLRHSDGLYTEIYDVDIARSAPNIIYSVTTGGGPGPLTGNLPSSSEGAYKSEDGGTTWSRINCGIQQNGGRTTALYVDPVNSLHAILAISGGETSFHGEGISAGKYIEGEIYATTDGGASWERLEVAPNNERDEYIYFREASSNPSLIFVFGFSRDNPEQNVGFLKSTDGDNTWNPFAPAMQDKSITYFGVSADGSTLYAISDSDAERFLHRSRDGGNTWASFFTMSSGYTLTVSPQDSDQVLYGQIDGLHLSTDGLVTSSRLFSSDERMSDLVFALSDPSIVYAITQGYTLYKSTDAGDSFTEIKNLRDDVLNMIP